MLCEMSGGRAAGLRGHVGLVLGPCRFNPSHSVLIDDWPHDDSTPPLCLGGNNGSGRRPAVRSAQRRLVLPADVVENDLAGLDRGEAPGLDRLAGARSEVCVQQLGSVANVEPKAGRQPGVDFDQRTFGSIPDPVDPKVTSEPARREDGPQRLGHLGGTVLGMGARTPGEVVAAGAQRVRR